MLEHILLDLVDAIKFGRGETPLQVGVSTEGAGARARRVDEHSVKLALQAADAFVSLAADRDRMHVGETRSAHAGRKARKALFVDVKGIEAARRAHQGADGERLAARTRAKVADHFTAARGEQAGDELGTLVLNVHLAFLVDRHWVRPASSADERRRG